MKGVARIERQADNFSIVDDGAQRAGLAFHEGRRAGDFDALIDGPELEFQIEAQPVIDAHLNAGSHIAAEAGGFDGDAVHSGA